MSPLPAEVMQHAVHGDVPELYLEAEAASPYTLMLVLPALGIELDSRDTYVPQLTAWHSMVADTSFRI